MYFNLAFAGDSFGLVGNWSFTVGPDTRKEVNPQNHVLGREYYCSAVCGVQKIPGAEHKGPTFHLGRLGQRHMNRHLVSVKVGVKGITNQRRQLNCLSFHKNRLKRLYPKAVQRRRPVQEHRVLFYHLVQNCENLRGLLLHKDLCLLDIVNNIFIDKLLHNEGLEKFQSHFGGQSALPHFKIGADGNYTAA